jgi:hypothetical protein
MAITVDKANNRATDEASGMAVAYVRNDYPLEHGEFWSLAWKGTNYEFRVGWDNGYAKIVNEHENLSFEEHTKLMRDLNLWEYSIPLVRVGLNEREFLDNIDVFIDLFAAVARTRHPRKNLHVIFEPGDVRRQFHRDIRFPPSDAAP